MIFDMSFEGDKVINLWPFIKIPWGCTPCCAGSIKTLNYALLLKHNRYCLFDCKKLSDLFKDLFGLSAV